MNGSNVTSFNLTDVNGTSLNATGSTGPEKTGFGGDLSIVFNDTTAIGAVSLVGSVILVIIARLFWNCHMSRKANETYWNRIMRIKDVASARDLAAKARKSIATSWQNPLARTPTALASADDLDIEPVALENRPRWQMSAIVASTLTRAAISNAAQQLEESADPDSRDERKAQARLMVRQLRRLTINSKQPRYMLTTVGAANRDAEVGATLDESFSAETPWGGSGLTPTEQAAAGIGLPMRQGKRPGRVLPGRTMSGRGGRPSLREPNAVARYDEETSSAGGSGSLHGSQRSLRREGFDGYGYGTRNEIQVETEGVELEGENGNADASSEEAGGALPEGWTWREEGDHSIIWIDPDGMETSADPRSSGGGQ